MRIGICDDDARQRKYLKELCMDCCAKLGLACKITEFSSGEEVLANLTESIDLLFLDIEMKKQNGIATMQQLETVNTVWRIVFVTDYDKYVWDSFGLKTLDYAVKPVGCRQVMHWITIAQKELEEETVLKFGNKEDKEWCNLNELCFLQAQGSYVMVHKKSEQFISTRNLRFWMENLNQGKLLRAHKSFVVNADFIREVKDDVVILTVDKTRIPIGRSFKKDFMDQYNAYILKKLKKRR